MSQVQQAGAPVNLSASGAVSLVPCNVIGYHVNSTGGGTLVFRDGPTVAGTAVNAATTPLVGFTAFPASMSSGCFLTISGTIDVTVFVQGG